MSSLALSLNSSAAASNRLVGKPGLPSGPWALFDRLWTSAMGYHADEFRFVQGETPMSTFAETAAAIVAYVVIVFGGRELMRNRAPMKLDFLFKLHNFALSALSGALLALFIEQLAPTIWRDGLYENICGDDGWTPQLVTLYYLNYITKYVELLDTLFLVLKKKPLIFLHVYHHPATALLCYTQLVGTTAISWVPITLNLTVHVVMYWYYFQAARGVKVWWKRHITHMQIAQFVIDLGFVYFASWDYFVNAYDLPLPKTGQKLCKGTPFAAAMGCSILSSYLVLFIMFYLDTYIRKSRGRAAAASQGGAKGGGALDLKDNVSAVKQGAAKVAKGTTAHASQPLAER